MFKRIISIIYNIFRKQNSNSADEKVNKELNFTYTGPDSQNDFSEIIKEDNYVKERRIFLEKKPKNEELEKNGIKIIFKSKVYYFYDLTWYRFGENIQDYKMYVSKRIRLELEKELIHLLESFGEEYFFNKNKYYNYLDVWFRINRDGSISKRKVSTKLSSKIRKLTIPKVKSIKNSTCSNKIPELSINQASKLNYNGISISKEFRDKYSKLIDSNSMSKLQEEEKKQLIVYLWVFIKNNFSEHWQVNNKISTDNSWQEFKVLRSLNDHGYKNRIKGIAPKYFAIVCQVLKIGGDDGAPLESYEKY